MKTAMSKKVICLTIVGSMLTTNFAFASEIKKDESVYATLNENGNVRETIVSDWIHSDSNLGEIHDFSNLENIKNVKSDEKPDKNGNDIIWKTDKKDIFYTGNTNLEIPMGVNVTYYLNNSEISPKDIAGKDGTIKIKIRFENKSKHTTTINGKNRDIYTPMTTLAIINLPEDTFTNVTAKNAQIVSDGNNQVVTLIAFPGMKESLGLSNLDSMKLDLQLPEEFEITAEAKKIKMGPILVTSTPILPDIKGFKDAKNLDELKDGITKLKDAVNDISKGSKDLNSGINAAKNGAVQLRDGIGQAKSGVTDLTGKLSQNEDKIELITNDNKVSAENKLINDAFVAMNMDTSMLSLLPGIIDPQNKMFLDKCMGDYAALDVNGLMSDPILKSLPAMAGPENMKNIGKLLNDTEGLSKIDMTKIKPMMGLLSAAPQLKGLLGQAVQLNNSADVKKIQGLMIAQQQQGQTFVASADKLNTDANIAKLNAAVDTNPNLSDAYKAQLKAVIGGYSQLISGTRTNIVNSGQQLTAMAPALDKAKALQDNLNAHPELIQGLNALLSDENIKYLQTIFPQLEGMQQDLKDNANNLAAVKLLLQKVQDPKSQETIKQIEVLQNDVNQAKPMIDKIKGSLTPSMIGNLEKSTVMINQLTSMQKDLKDNQKILDVVQDALKDGNVKQAQQLIGSMPTLIGGINKLSDGSVALVDGMTKLSDGSKKLSDGVDTFNEEGISKIDSKVTPIMGDLDDVLAAKDELVKLSDEYKSFSGIGKDMDGTVKFIMKTDEIKVSELTVEKKTVNKEEKPSFFQWIKNLFN